MEVHSVVVQRSPAILLLQMILTTVVASFLFSIASLLLNTELLRMTLPEFIENEIGFFALSTGIEAAIIIALFLRWAAIRYEIRSGEIISFAGVLWRRKTMHSLRNSQAVYVEQSMLGRLLGYGNVSVHNPLSKEEVLLQKIAAPNAVATIVRGAIGEEHDHIVPSQRP